MAYYGSLGDIDVGVISNTKSETAVDVFVYDTRKDSDGGAWRKRTQHTSWYNETLNTATRGGRREFPAVAVIVATSSSVTIYDGDDPDMPMWMVFNRVQTPPYGFLSYTPSAVCMLNGILMFVGYTATRINFIQDFASIYFNTGYYQWLYPEIINRNASSNSGGSTPTISSSISIVNVNTYDVAMTVLPNAPIDPSTGLPIPTIAVATNGGVSVIRDDGNVISTTGSGYYVKKINFTDDYGLNVIISNSSNGNWVNAYVNDYTKINGLSYIAYNNFDGVVYQTKYDPKALTYKTASTNDTISNFIDIENRSSAIGVAAIGGGLTLLEKSPKNTFDPDSGMVAYATSSYNTGWMHGDIKGAFLSDTDTTAASSSSLISGNNSTFDSGTGNWSAPYQSTVAAVNGQLEMTATDSNPYATLFVTGLIIGRQYRVDLQSISNNFSSGFVVYYGNDGGLYRTQYGSNNITTPNKYEKYFTATTTSLNIQVVGNGSVGQVGVIDNVFLYELEEDRSVNAKGLQVFGTITKSPVATGAELVAYSGFTASNHLRQPPNSDMNIGTGDAYEMIWYRTDATSGTMMLISYEGGANGTQDYGKPFNIRMTNGVIHGWASHNGFSTYDDVSHGVSTADGTWHHAAWVKKGQVFELYVDGKFIGSDTGAVGSNALSDANSELVIGGRKRGLAPGTCEEPFTGFLTLARIGKSAPSPDQIRKIYEDEKVLFQENAACTLYGTSDAVTALAYDDTTNLLHVGTSSGRSEFKGLRRVGNTTTPVTTTISASNGLVAEQ